jgi:diguanylate cyclase (GGDEF)-like protein
VFGHHERWWRALTVVALLVVFYATELLDTPKLFSHLPQAYIRISYLTVIPLITVLVAVVLQSFLNELHQRGLLERAEGMESQARRMGMPLCVVMVDIDHFKAVNDQHGHQVGDRLLAAVARTLRESIRKEDALGRMGGEEFAVVLFNATLAEGLNTAEHLRRQVGAVQVPNDKLRPMSCTVSLGVAALATTDEHLSRTLARADQALYRAKAEGRNRVCAAPPATASVLSGGSAA